MRVSATPTGHVRILATADEAAALAGRASIEANARELRDKLAAEVWRATSRSGRAWSGRDRHVCRLERPTVESEYWQDGYGEVPPRRMSRAECIGKDPFRALRRLIEQHGDEAMADERDELDDDERDDDEGGDDGCVA